MGAASKPAVTNGRGNNFDRTLPADSPLRAIAGIERVSWSKQYPRSAIPFSEGQVAVVCMCFVRGSAKISICSADGRKLIMRIAKPGAVLGLYAGLTGRPYEATAEALESCRVEFVGRADLLRILDQDKQAYFRMVQSLSNKFSGVVDHIRVLLLSQSAAERLARLLIKWCDDVGRWTPQGIRVNPSLTHEEMGQMICASRETVTRVLSEFRRRQIVHLARHSILVRDRKALESIANCENRPGEVTAITAID